MRCKKHISDVTSNVGVCSSCLRERLFSLIAAQARAESLSQEPHLSRLHSSSSTAAAEDLHRKSDPPPLIFPRSVSPYVTRRKVDDPSWNFQSPLDNNNNNNNHHHHRRYHHRFYSTPQVGPTFNAADNTFFTSKKPNRSRFSLWSSLFRSRSDKLDTIPKDSTPSFFEPPSSSSASSSSWISSIFFGRRKKPSSSSSKLCSIDQRKKQSRFFSRGMSPARPGDFEKDYEDRCDGSPSASGYSSDSSKWKPSPAVSQGSTRRGRQGLSRNSSGLAFCLSPLVRASPNRGLWNQKGLPPDLTYSGEVRVQTKPHLSAAASFCANRSRKLADFGRVNGNR